MSAKLPFDILSLPDILVSASKQDKITPIHFVRTSLFDKWLVRQPEHIRNQVALQEWRASEGSFLAPLSQDGLTESVYIGMSDKAGLYTACAAAEKLPSGFYEIASGNFTAEEFENICTGWLIACYQFDHYKTSDKKFPRLVWPKKINKKRVEAIARAIYVARHLINLPANILGPSELAHAVATIAEEFDAMFRIVKDKDLLDENLPLIHAVGDGSERRPCLAELAWGNPKHPKVTLVGKGICFDTGGNDIKPSAGMLLMKKDMGGAAMALATAQIIMELELPVYLRVLIPCAENSVSGRSFRPGDILASRSGKTIEVGNTDAEGRLVLADCLTMACEESPDLLVDFATLTGAAHYAVGFDMGTVYSNDDKLGYDVQKLSLQLEDPLWNMPLWQDYKKDITSPIADLSNTGGSNPAGSITAALFLQHFVDPSITWVHIDERAWQSSPKPGRPQGGKDMGIRTIYTLIEQKFAKPKAKKKKSAAK